MSIAPRAPRRTPPTERHLTPHLALTFVGLLAMAGGLGCPPPPSPPPDPSCEPEQVQRCSCPVGGGTQVCADDGKSFSTCVCPIERAVLKEGVEALGEKSAGFTLEGDRLTLGVAGNERLRDLDPGTVIVSYEGAGFLKRVVEVEEVGDRFELITEPAGLTEAFDELEVNFSGHIDPERYLSEADRELLRSPRLSVPISGLTVSFGGAGGGFSGEAAISIDEPSNFSIDLGAEFALKLRPALNPVEALEELRAEVSVEAGVLFVTTFSVSGSLTYEESINIIEEIQRAAGNPFANGITIPIGNGFSAFVDVALTCGVNVSGEVSVTTELEAGLDFYAGVEWDDDDNVFRALPAQVDPFFEAGVTDFNYGAQSTLYCALQPQAGITFLSVADAFIQAGPEASVGLGIDNTSYHVGVSAEINGSLGADVTLEFAGAEANLLSASYPLFSFPLTTSEGDEELWGTDFSICGDGWRHLDEECDVG